MGVLGEISNPLSYISKSLLSLPLVSVYLKIREMNLMKMATYFNLEISVKMKKTSRCKNAFIHPNKKVLSIPSEN
jgi:hypothetical protein